MKTSESAKITDPELCKKLHDALNEIAQSQFSHERINHTLQPTALVNELWLRILRSEDEPPTNIDAFRVWASKAVHHILISHARGKNAIKRGGDWVQVPLQTIHGAQSEAGINVLELEEELILLEKHNPRAARVVEMRFYGGMSHCEVAKELGISERFSQQLWAMARSWLSIRLQDA